MKELVFCMYIECLITRKDEDLKTTSTNCMFFKYCMVNCPRRWLLLDLRAAGVIVLDPGRYDTLIALFGIHGDRSTDCIVFSSK
jgi:hypothetical protein